MEEQKRKKAPAKPKRLPKKYEPAGAVLWKCSREGCGSTATRAVYQHGHMPENPNDSERGAAITWEIPAYADANGQLCKWPCPLCKEELAPVLIKCGECARATRP
jgi:hypothetical protein